MSRNRSYCISRKSERKSSSNVEGSDQDGITYHRHLGFRSDNSLESTSLGIHVQSSNKIALEKNDREYQNTNPDARLLATNTEESDDALGRELLEARFEAPMDSKNKTKEQENMSDNSDTDYDEKLSNKESEDAEKKTEECQVRDVDSQTSMDRSLNLQDEEKAEEPSRLFGLDNKDTDEGEMQSADHLNEVSSPEITMLQNLDHLQEGNSYTEPEIYETQLLQLQDQLVETMMKEQEATETLENLKLDAVLKELEEEKTKTSELTARLEFMKNKMKNSSLERLNASRRIRRRSRNVETNESQKEKPFGYDGERATDDNHQEKPDDATLLPADDTEFSFDEGHFAVAPDTTCEDKTAPPSKFAKLQEYKHVIIETIIDRLGDFVNEDSGTSKHKDDDDDDGDALSVITLKENINRCKSGAKPIIVFVEPVIDILTWSSPVASVMTFLVYMFAVVHGYLLSLAILLVILQLSSNYFYASGLADKLGFKCKEEPPPHDDKKLSDRFQLVLQVAKKVQNALGEVANSLEKIKNLLRWQHPVTKKLFIVLCVGFVVSVLLDGATLFLLAGVGIGVKLFIVRPIYSKFPKVKKRYDNLARIWADLPTDADLAKSAKHADAKYGPASPGSPKFDSSNFVTSWANPCVRMKIPLTEYPVPSWEEGHRCTLMTKDKPLAKLKQGKLFLTQNYLCFERYKFGVSKNVIIKLKDTISVDKYKPMNIMPGTGMSIKVEFKGSYKPYIFGGLLTRDELYDSLIATCKAAKVPWAC